MPLVSPYLLGLFEQMRMLRNMGLVAVTIWLYDIMLTFSDELVLLWSRNGPLIKLLYISVRWIYRNICYREYDPLTCCR
jgi:hypothetical protein